MSGLLKKRPFQPDFSSGLHCDRPDIRLDKLPHKAENSGNLRQIALRGLDTLNPGTMQTQSLNGNDVPCRLLDTDYDGQCFRAGQVFFPRTAAYDTIRTAVRADFATAVWNRLRGSTSAPFVAGQQIAVKALNERGNERLGVKPLTETKQ